MDRIRKLYGWRRRSVAGEVGRRQRRLAMCLASINVAFALVASIVMARAGGALATDVVLGVCVVALALVLTWVEVHILGSLVPWLRDE